MSDEEGVKQKNLGMIPSKRRSVDSIDTCSSTSHIQCQFNAEFKCPCGQCNLRDYLDKGCPKYLSSSTDFPYLHPRGLNPRDKEDVIQKLSDETTDIIQAFADLTFTTMESLKNRNIPVKKLVSVICGLILHKSNKNPLPLSDVDFQELNKAKSIDEASVTLQKYMSFFNNEKLADIIDKLGDHEDKENLKKFKCRFEDFCKRRVFEVSPTIYSSGYKGENYQLFVVLVTEDFIQTLTDVKRAQRKIASILGLHSSVVQLERIDQGSIILVFSIPLVLSQELFPLKPAIYEELKSCGYTLIVPPTPTCATYEELLVPIIQQVESKSEMVIFCVFYTLFSYTIRNPKLYFYIYRLTSPPFLKEFIHHLMNFRRLKKIIIC